MIYAETNATLSSRKIYNFLDYLGDVGGLLEALKLISAVFFWVLSNVNSNSGLSNWLVSKLFFMVPKPELI